VVEVVVFIEATKSALSGHPIWEQKWNEKEVKTGFPGQQNQFKAGKGKRNKNRVAIFRNRARNGIARD